MKIKMLKDVTATANESGNASKMYKEGEIVDSGTKPIAYGDFSRGYTIVSQSRSCAEMFCSLIASAKTTAPPTLRLAT